MSATTFANLRKLRLSTMAEALAHQLDTPGTYEEVGFEERLDLLIDHELNSRRSRRQQRHVKRAGFRLAATLNDIDYRRSRNLNRQQIAQLGQCDWVARAQSVLISGACGTGKTYLSCALGHSACMMDYSVQYMRVAQVFSKLSEARATGEFHKVVQRLAAVKVLIIDDWGLKPLDAMDRHDLAELIDQRYGRTATVVVSQLPTDKWYGAIGDATLAEAILDRLLHNAHRIELKGESMRKRTATQLNPVEREDGVDKC